MRLEQVAADESRGILDLKLFHAINAPETVADWGRACGEDLDWRMRWEAGSGLLVWLYLLLACASAVILRVTIAGYT